MSTTINPYLTFNGNCEEVFTFYKSVFGGEFQHVGRFGEMPEQEGGQALTDELKNRIMHISLPISPETVLLGSDTFGAWADQLIVGNNFSISITTDSRENADRLFVGLSAGGQVTMPMNKTFWGSYFGMLTDKFGINWMISFDVSGE
ncbi:VOC family protein [Dyadobacter sp. 32]|uniref:VOC family protein n=1 Tax=Dyadobacter sp. 32 TaxID=538966 RepID=UPI0011F03FE2